MSVEILHLHVQWTASGFSLDVREDVYLAGVTAVFGPSGSGKSTLLRSIAGFESPDAGRIARHDEVWFDADSNINIPPHRRPVGFMFQDTRLFAHLDVAGNLAFAVKRVRRPAPHFSYDGVVEALDLHGLLSRKVAALSGGERQRVALARTLLSAPDLLLLDEPLAALDQARKAEILPYLQSLPRTFGIPALYVSHDIDEVAMLADRILVLSDGRVQMHDGAAQVMERLDLQPAGGRYEGGVLLEGSVVGHDRRLHLTRIDVLGDELILPLLDRVAVGGLVRLRIRARDVSLATQRPVGLSIRNVLAGTLRQIDADREAGVVLADVQLRGAHVRSRLTLAAVEDLALAPGQPVYALIKSVSFEGTT